MPTSYNGWSASKDPSAIGIVPFVVQGESFPSGVKGGDVEVVFRYLCEQFHRRVEPLVRSDYHQADDWGYYYRANVNNPSTLSCHSSGTAIDINATRHPNGSRGTFTVAQFSEIDRILAELGSVVRQLRGYDEMHFEISGSKAEVAEVARRIRAGQVAAQSAVDPTPIPAPEDDMPLNDTDKAYIAQKLNESEGQIMGAVRHELANVVQTITGGVRTRDADGNVIDPDPKNVSTADVYTRLEQRIADLAALIRSKH